jgi:hypothetical protein
VVFAFSNKRCRTFGARRRVEAQRVAARKHCNRPIDEQSLCRSVKQTNERTVEANDSPSVVGTPVRHDLTSMHEPEPVRAARESCDMTRFNLDRVYHSNRICLSTHRYADKTIKQTNQQPLERGERKGNEKNVLVSIAARTRGARRVGVALDLRTACVRTNRKTIQVVQSNRERRTNNRTKKQNKTKQNKKSKKNRDAAFELQWRTDDGRVGETAALLRLHRQRAARTCRWTRKNDHQHGIQIECTNAGNERSQTQSRQTKETNRTTTQQQQQQQQQRTERSGCSRAGRRTRWRSRQTACARSPRRRMPPQRLGRSSSFISFVHSRLRDDRGRFGRMFTIHIECVSSSVAVNSYITTNPNYRSALQHRTRRHSNTAVRCHTNKPKNNNNSMRITLALRGTSANA